MIENVQVSDMVSDIEFYVPKTGALELRIRRQGGEEQITLLVPQAQNLLGYVTNVLIEFDEDGLIAPAHGTRQ